MRVKVTILLGFIFFFSACAEKQPIPDAKMKAILKDLMIVEAGNQMKYNFGLLPDSLWHMHYSTVFKLHKTDSAVFREAIHYFDKNPEAFSKIMEDVITDLQKESMQKGSK